MAFRSHAGGFEQRPLGNQSTAALQDSFMLVVVISAIQRPLRNLN